MTCTFAVVFINKGSLGLSDRTAVPLLQRDRGTAILPRFTGESLVLKGNNDTFTTKIFGEPR
jgi:hypothetical protein